MTKTGALFTKCFVWLGRIHRKNQKDPKHFLNLLTIFFFVQTSKATTKEIEVMTDVWKYYVLHKTFTTFLLFRLRGARSVDTLIKDLLVQNARNVPPTLVDLLTCLFFFLLWNPSIFHYVRLMSVILWKHFNLANICFHKGRRKQQRHRLPKLLWLNVQEFKQHP